MEKFIAKTNVSINIVLPTGANRHIAFSSLTGGGSVFYTDDPAIIEAMERHYKYGTLFRKDIRYGAENHRNKPVFGPNAGITAGQPNIYVYMSASESEHPDGDSDGVAEDEDNGLKAIEVSDPDSAKTYLAEHFGLSRTKFKSIKSIKEAAAANGIVFVGLD